MAVENKLSSQGCMGVDSDIVPTSKRQPSSMSSIELSIIVGEESVRYLCHEQLNDSFHMSVTMTSRCTMNLIRF